jgi:hypothetical protein
MNIEKKILEIYEEINNSKKIILEVTDYYDNVNFKDNGNMNPSRDNINTSLLGDINTAAKNAGVVVDITTAVSGHGEKTTSGNTSRHPSGNAVDIAIINNKPVSVSNRTDADKFVGELVKLGYTKNTESSNPKAVLTFGFPGHDDHVHVSYTNQSTSDSSSSSTSGITTPKGNLDFKTNDTTFINNIANPLVSQLKAGIGIKEQTIKGRERFYLQFCNISQLAVKNGQQISAGTLLGKTDTDVEVSKFDTNRTKIRLKKGDIDLGKNIKEYLGVLTIPKDSNTKIKSPVSGIVTTKYNSSCKNQITIEYYVGNDKVKDDRGSRTKSPTFSDPLMGAILTAPLKIFKDKYDDSGNLEQKRFGYSGERVDPWVKDAIVAPFKKIGDLFRKENKEEEERKKKKVDENIEKIKKLLK